MTLSFGCYLAQSLLDQCMYNAVRIDMVVWLLKKSNMDHHLDFDQVINRGSAYTVVPTYLFMLSDSR
jgi:hypothetical protein